MASSRPNASSAASTVRPGFCAGYCAGTQDASAGAPRRTLPSARNVCGSNVPSRARRAWSGKASLRHGMNLFGFSDRQVEQASSVSGASKERFASDETSDSAAGPTMQPSSAASDTYTEVLHDNSKRARDFESDLVKQRLQNIELRISEVKCPFWKRRFTDTLETVQSVLAWISARHKKLLWFDEYLLAKNTAAGLDAKTINLCRAAAREIIRQDFEGRQYYITGNLSKALYCDDCLFDGPDPDVPVRGLRKYVEATSKLFDRRRSRIELLHICDVNARQVRAYWRLEGVLRLPWRPPIKPYLGSTTYTFNELGLVSSHFETWSISALDAFLSTLISPKLGKPSAPPLGELMRRISLEGPGFLDSATDCSFPLSAREGMNML
ncbi:hypothetical protein FVE85_0270 [Porphyridium purpureum]|uniref:Uncharacterized protein n=1 Tax=Porphyridium purpureum TaxID=35688 RepID=A0A5J4YY56_PORPP|nr:hypothetical protein FVE85_0270 [Porphyridium purpureum]|eukprot:POR2958..scf208_2